MIWREKRVLLFILGALLLANTAFFFTYRVQYEKRLQDLDARLHEAEGRLERARAARVSAEQQLVGYRKVISDLQVLYNERWATQPERFTALVIEIKKLTAASQMIPRSINFAESEDATKSGPTMGTSIVHISFSVQGTYQQVRRLINLLELSDQFVIIDAVGLGGGGGDQVLTLTLRLKTVFRATPRPGTTNKQAQAPSESPAGLSALSPPARHGNLRASWTG